MAIRIDIEDDGLAERLRIRAKARGISLREYIQELLRRAAEAEVQAQLPERYELITHDFGAHLENPWATLAEMELTEFTKLLSRK
jgi:plasmid stability protein